MKNCTEIYFMWGRNTENQGMSNKYGKNLNVRLTPDLSEKLERLTEAVPGLQQGALIRLMLKDTLTKPLAEQIQIVTSQLLKPDVNPPKPMGGRLKGLNSKKPNEI